MGTSKIKGPSRPGRSFHQKIGKASGTPSKARQKGAAGKIASLASSLVDLCIHGPSQRSGGEAAKAGLNPVAIIEVIEDGLPVEELNVLQDTLGLPMDRLAPKLGISKATLQRRKLTGRLDRDESDRVVRFARLVGKAIEVFDNEENARKWLISPQFALGGAIPLDFAKTEVGAREVEDLLGRIEYGVYS